MGNLKNNVNYILAAKIPRRIAEKKYPIPELAETIKDVCKIEIVPSNVMNFRGAPLNNTDEDLLINIIKNSGLDFDDYLGLTESQYKLFKAAFDSSENKPDWDILATFTNHRIEAFEKQTNLIFEHSLLLENAAKNGTVKILSSDHIPLDEIEGDAYISRKHAETYLKELGLTLNELGLSLQDAPNRNGETTKNDGVDSQEATETTSVKGKTSKSRQKGGQDKLRTSHFIEWLNQNKIHANKPHEWIDYELRLQKPGLWGKNFETFKTWLKTDEAKEAKGLLAELKLAARVAEAIAKK